MFSFVVVIFHLKRIRYNVFGHLTKYSPKILKKLKNSIQNLSIFTFLIHPLLHTHFLRLGLQGVPKYYEPVCLSFSDLLVKQGQMVTTFHITWNVKRNRTRIVSGSFFDKKPAKW